MASNELANPETGDVVEVVGESDGEGNYPRIRAAIVRRIRNQELPSPQPISLEQARTGISQNSIIEIRAILQRVHTEGAFLKLDFVCNSGNFQALIPAGEDLSRYVGAIVNIRGVCTLGTSGLRTPDVTVLLLSSAALSIIEQPANKLHSIPAQSIAALALNPPRPRAEKWMRTFGTLSHHREGSYLYVQEGNQTLRVFTSQPSTFTLGDHLDIIGLPAWYGDQLVIREALVQKNRSGEEVTPLLPPTPYQPSRDFENFLTTMEGVLVSSLDIDGKITLTLQDRGVFFNCELLHRPEKDSIHLAKGVTVRATGIYHITRSEEGNASAISLELRSPADIVVVRRPSWLSPERALGIVAILSIVSLIAGAWIIQLRKLVRKQTLTIRAQMEKEAQLTSDLERATRLESLGMLAGGIAHDFNNMLTIIVGNLSLARMDAPSDSPMISFLQEAERGAMRARNLTQQLLTFARGGNPIRKPENLGQLVKEEASDATGNDQLQLNYHFNEELHQAFVDRSQISQVVHSILANSIQANATQSFISLRNEQIHDGNVQGIKPGPYLRLSFRDDGPGIPPENLSKIFDPYFTTHKGQRGLGLSLVRSIVIKHDGYVSVASEPSSGAEILLWLPAAPKHSEAITHTSQTANTHSPTPLSTAPDRTTNTPQSGGTILLMDDEAPVRLMISALMRKMGYTITLTADGTAAIREYKSAMEAGRRFDLVILDLSVPNGMGGMEAMEQLRLLDPKVLAIVSSGYSNDPIMADHHSFGFAAMVPKPYQIEELTRTVENLLQK